MPRKISRRELVLGAGAIALSQVALEGCGSGTKEGGSQNGAGAVVNSSITATVTKAGATVVLPGIVSVKFPAGMFASAQSIILSSTSSSETSEKMDVVADLYNISTRVSYDVRINVGIASPNSSVDVTLSVPTTFLSSVTSGTHVVAFVQFDQSGDGEGLDEFAPVNAIFDTGARTLTLTLQQHAFTNIRAADSSYEAIVTIAVLPVPTKAVTRKGAHDRGFGPITDGLNAPLGDLLIVRSPWGFRQKPAKKYHLGVDLRALTPRPVLAAHDGTLTSTREVYKEGPNKGLDKPLGYGLYAVVKHLDGTSTLYGHLSSITAQGSVKKGQVIAMSGATGGANPDLGDDHGPHLHFEYCLAGVQVDPMPFVQVLSELEPSGSVNIKSGTTLQLKAKDAVGNSMAEDHTGKPLKLGDLKWDSSKPDVVSVDSKGLVMANNEGQATVTATQTSSNKKKTVIINVGADPYKMEFVHPNGLAGGIGGDGAVYNAVSGLNIAPWTFVQNGTPFNHFRINFDVPPGRYYFQFESDDLNPWNVTLLDGVTFDDGSTVGTMVIPPYEQGNLNFPKYYFVVT